MGYTDQGTVSYAIENKLRTILKRCLVCEGTPPCPPCSNGEICSLVPSDCNTCAHMICVRNPNPPPPSIGPNVGAIAGGVIGGVALVALIVFFLWRFWIKKRREQQELEAEEWEEDDIAQQKATHQFNAMHQDAASTRTRGSLANSILSRASNIIHIAYIPGVTNRNGSGHNSLLASPVPPIPAARGSIPRSPLSNQGDALFFRPGDLRDSSYSATSSIASDKRDTQYTRKSITPSLARSSMTSAIYQDSATVEPMPATTVVRAAPRMVSVKSTTSGSPTETADSSTSGPGTDLADFAAAVGKGKGVQIMMPGQAERVSPSPSSARGMPSFGKAQQIVLGSKGKGRFPVRQTSDASTAASAISKHAPAVSSPLAEADDSSDEEEEHARARQSLTDTEPASPPRFQPVESPFFDPSERPSAERVRQPNPYASMARTVGTSVDEKPKRSGKGMGGLSAVIEEATKRASRVPSHDGLGGKWDVTPFNDSHEAED